MKKEKIRRGLFIAAGVLALLFCVSLPVCYSRYTTGLYSAPFYCTVIVKAVEYLLPAAALLIAGAVMGPGDGNRKEEEHECN